MPRRQRFKPSRKPKPAIDPSDADVVIQPTAAKPTIDQSNHDANIGQRTDAADVGGDQVIH
ncbi:MAG TPA: hypothetical protein VK427_18760 [Kofleriaceae bacterium]|nr:hypothetical protein [Kofleriaceae bacterium]